MKHQCALLLQLFLLGLLPILILSSESPDRGNIIDVSSNAKTKPEGDMHWIVQRDAVLKQRRLRKARRKMKLEKRIKKCKKVKCCKKGPKGKKHEAGSKKKLLGGKQDKDKLRKRVERDNRRTKTNCIKRVEKDKRRTQ